ncbi:hypothetical protein HYH03_008411 [Edaphochlamys debaryana]|uniref:Metallo-beta-lactamase domain-containing protein n=1 Tax=Edaphochlamys debaryana TaxID=47281 RepID=A0A835Y0X4_9CHLO|nr:hypothetical protein HYH03_008411 [Edaphochlamys debaryana]|eukprot:KAG2493274.1 hypothetical protein HYH03_008411 [Edaphochlamys debaryana]
MNSFWGALAWATGGSADSAHGAGTDGSLEIVILGTGAGTTCVYGGERSSSFVVLLRGEPVLLADVGYGATAACVAAVGRVPPALYVSHNHSDHAGELPVVLSVESTAAAAAGRGPPTVYSHPDVMEELKQHRLRELRSTGKPLESFGAFLVTPGGAKTAVGATGLHVRPHRSKHSETCFGFVLYRGSKAVLGWTADSGYCEELYSALAEAPLVLLDARAQGSAEHAGFDDLARIAALPAMKDRSIYVTGYGLQNQAPQGLDVKGVTVARPGMRLTL